MTREEAISVLKRVEHTESKWPGTEDTLEALHMAISALRQQDQSPDSGKMMQREPMTNADRIRSMSDEELAWELMLWRCEAVARQHGISSEYPDTQQTILKWIKQPAGEEDKHENYT